MENYIIDQKNDNCTTVSIYRVHHKETQQKRVIKRIRKRGGHKRYRWSREVCLHKLCSHPNIVKVLDFFQDSTYAFIVMEAMETDLYKYIRFNDNLNLTQIKQCLRDIAQALLYCHQQEIIFCDLKLENILTTNCLSVFKLCDFGWSHRIGDIVYLCGTLDYLSPEMIADEAGVEHDAWTLGIVCYELLSGSPPFETEETGPVTNAKDTETVNKILHCEPDLDYLESTAHEFITGLLAKNPQKRMTIEDALAHSFLEIE